MDTFSELNSTQQAIVRVLFKHGSMESYDIATAVFAESITSDLDALVDTGWIKRIFLGKHPRGGYPYDKFSLLPKGKDAIHETYGEDIGWRLATANLTGKLLEDV